MTDDLRAKLVEVKRNIALLETCPLHQFNPDNHAMGAKMKCMNCGGTMRAPAIADYVRGYQAAGGYCDDIWPGFETRRFR